MRVLVCGSNYGATYIRALAGGQDGLRLAGILSTGSARSQAYAQRAGVSHFTSVEQFDPAGIDLACVAVPGKTGHQLALALLSKGIHVMCEHPVGPEQMAQALEVAQDHGRVFQVNAHFADLAAPQAFFRGLAVAREVGPVLQFDMSLNLRTLYSGLDLLGRAAGSLEGIEVALAFSSGSEPAPFANVWLTGRQWRASLLCQNFASAQDDGSAALLNHRCSATFGHGNLLLAESNGPVLWFPSPVSMPRAMWRTWLPIEMDALDPAGLQQQRDAANRQALLDMLATIRGEAAPALQQQNAYLRALAGLWQRVLRVLQPRGAGQQR